jgi:hypothetical protein
LAIAPPTVPTLSQPVGLFLVVRYPHHTTTQRRSTRRHAYTVPLCRDHHRQLHQAGNEVAWWHDLDIKALEIAKELWDESRMKTFPTVAQAPRQQAPADPPQAALRQDASKLPNEAN